MFDRVLLIMNWKVMEGITKKLKGTVEIKDMFFFPLCVTKFLLMMQRKKVLFSLIFPENGPESRLLVSGF